MLTPLGSYVELKAQQVTAATRHRVALGTWDEQTRGQGREGGDKGGMYNIYIYILYTFTVLYTVYLYCILYTVKVFGSGALGCADLQRRLL